MFYLLYDLFQCLVLLIVAPKFLWEGRFKKRLAPLFSLFLPKVLPKKGKVFLFYAVSMGEVRAAASLFQEMKKAHPEDQFYMVSRTATGMQEAESSIPGADGYFLLPLDLSWVMRRFIKKVRPDVVIVIESDFWLNFLRLSKKYGARVFLASGKLSLRSFKRFKKLPFFSKKLFSFFDLLCIQNAQYQERFVSLGVPSSKASITGNLKFDMPFERSDLKGLRGILGIQKEDKVLVLASTHAPEEEAILKGLYPLWEEFPQLKVLLVPRHPYRFEEVKEMLDSQPCSFVSYSRIKKKTGKEQVILIDVMGLLPSLYQIADLAIVGGSFFSWLNGHNIFEPVQAGVPVLFGPYMSAQKDFVECILGAKAGEQIALKDLPDHVRAIFQEEPSLQAMQSRGKDLLVQMRGASSHTSKSLTGKIYEKSEKK